MFVCFYKNNNAIHKDTQQDLSSETWMRKADVISRDVLTLPTHQKPSFSHLPWRIKMERNQNREGRRNVSFPASISCAHCEQHSGLCTTEDTQHGTQTCLSWGHHTAALIWSWKSWAVSTPQDLWFPPQHWGSPPHRNGLHMPLFSVPSTHFKNMHLTVTTSFSGAFQMYFYLILNGTFLSFFVSPQCHLY